MTEQGNVQGGRHAAPEGAEPSPFIDLSRDPNPGIADHAAPEPDAPESNSGR